MSRLLCCTLALTVLAAAVPLAAQSAEADTDDLAASIRALRTHIRDQERRLAQLETIAVRQREAQRQALMDVVREMQADAGQRSGMPKWMKNLTFYGDLRLRYQADCWSSHDTWNRKTRHRARFRLRFGIKKTWLDKQMEVGFRLVTGEFDGATGDSEPTDPNQTFTNVFSKKNIWIDLAYAIYKPNWLKGLMIAGGKVPNPFLTSPLFIDHDVNPEGFYAQYAPQIGPFQPFGGAGYLILWEVNQAPNNAYDTILVGYAAGVHWQITKDVKYTFAANLFDYDHYDTNIQALAAAGAIPARGNNLAWGSGWDFLVLNLHNQVAWKLFGLPFSAYFDWAHNCQSNDSTHDYRNKDDAYAAGIKVGENKRKGDWSFNYQYGWIEANSIPGYIAYSDFGNANRQGHVWKAKYNLTDFLAAGLSVYLTQPIRSVNDEDDRVSVRADLVWKF